MAFSSLLFATLISSALASVGPTADLTLSNGDVAPDGFTRQAVLVNGQAPGPLIVGNKLIIHPGRRINLNVIDQLTNETMLLSSTIHWHGFFEKNNSWADGVAFVSQCPIAVNNSFLHLATQYCDGLRGPLVVYDPDDPHASLYDVDDESTVITLADCSRSTDHGPASTLGLVPTLVSTLINGLGRFAGGPTSQLAVVSVTSGQRYRMRLVAMSCDPNFTFSIDGHTMTIIEVDSVNVQPLTVDSIQISLLVRPHRDQTVDNYFIRTVANGGTVGFDNGINTAILRYVGADETDLHPLVATAVPGTAVAGGADVVMNLAITLDFTSFTFEINGDSFTPPTVPVLLQILSGAQSATDLLPTGSLSIPGGSAGAPHPFHLHGHNFFVIKSAGNDTYNFDNPVIRDVVSTGTATTHIDFHLELGLAIVFAEDTGTVANSVQTTQWDALCPTYDALPTDEL
ncbi:yellow laccase [Mycena rosella]|uniref:Yellow laccase n=1 Tax=Mycena rosella TaxID=1033263 RepID=A0AAD7CTI2_MYCRO|nr:yellow laccase [Mycena rosella]